MTHKLWDGTVAQLDQEFVVITASYISYLFENADAKTNCGGRILTVDDFTQKLSDDVKILNMTGEEYDVPSTIGLIANNKVLEAQRNAQKQFPIKLEELCGTNYLENFIDEDKFCVDLEQAAAHVTKLFKDVMHKTENVSLTADVQEAIKVIDVEFEEWVAKQKKDLQKSNAAKADKILNHLAVPLAIACGLWLLDYMSDLLCDGWSDTCQAASSGFNLTYNIIFVITICMMLWTANKYGGQRLATIGPALIGETIAVSTRALNTVKDKFEKMKGGEAAGAADKKEKFE